MHNFHETFDSMLSVLKPVDLMLSKHFIGYTLPLLVNTPEKITEYKLDGYLEILNNPMRPMGELSSSLDRALEEVAELSNPESPTYAIFNVQTLREGTGFSTNSNRATPLKVSRIGCEALKVAHHPRLLNRPITLLNWFDKTTKFGELHFLKNQGYILANLYFMHALSANYDIDDLLNRGYADRDLASTNSTRLNTSRLTLMLLGAYAKKFYPDVVSVIDNVLVNAFKSCVDLTLPENIECLNNVEFNSVLNSTICPEYIIGWLITRAYAYQFNGSRPEQEYLDLIYVEFKSTIDTGTRRSKIDSSTNCLLNILSNQPVFGSNKSILTNIDFKNSKIVDVGTLKQRSSRTFSNAVNDLYSSDFLKDIRDSLLNASKLHDIVQFLVFSESRRANLESDANKLIDNVKKLFDIVTLN